MLGLLLFSLQAITTSPLATILCNFAVLCRLGVGSGADGATEQDGGGR